jgi:hypothetical protein
MARLRIALVLMILFVASVKFWRMSTTPQVSGDVTSPAAPSNANEGAAPTTATANTPAASSSLAPSAASAIDQANQEIIRSCLAKDPQLPRVHFGDPLKLEDLLNDLAPDATKDESTMNIHVRRSDGREERLHITPHDPENRSAYAVGSSDVRVFTVDSEGLPIGASFPENLKRDSLKDVVDRFIGKDAVTFRERRSKRTTPDLTASSVETNGQLTELQVNFKDQTLGCAWQNTKLNCRCL